MAPDDLIVYGIAVMSRDSSPRWVIAASLCSFALVLFGLKLWVILTWGNGVPFWDQWDAEALYLYQPLLEGRLTLPELMGPHNEHRILTTRLLALALLGINNQWNPLLQMVVNALLHIGVICTAAVLVNRTFFRPWLPLLMIFLGGLFGVPYAWENTLAGFQAQFYLVVLFSLGVLWSCSLNPAWSPRWLLGLACAGLAFYSLASGVFAIAAVIAIMMLQAAQGERGLRHLSGIAFLGGLFLLGVWATPRLEAHASLKAHSISEFFTAFVTIEAWPFPPNLVWALLRNLPALILLVLLFAKRPERGHTDWFLGALSVWAIGQGVATAYGRASYSLSSRYLDLYAMAVFVNMACLVRLASTLTSKWKWVLPAWPIAILIVLVMRTSEIAPPQLEHKRRTGISQQETTHGYLLTGDRQFLENKELEMIPYPDPARLMAILESPQLRDILPGTIRVPMGPPVATGALVLGGTSAATAPAEGGSFGTAGPAELAEGTLLFEHNERAGPLTIPVAGDVLREGISLHLEQNGKSSPIEVFGTPGDGWRLGYATVAAGPFSIVLQDASATGWVAVGWPTRHGWLDHFVTVTLAHWRWFVAAGLLVLLGALAYGRLRKGVDRQSGDALRAAP